MFKYPKILTENSTAQLVDSMVAVLEKTELDPPSGVPQFVIVPSYGPLPLTGLWATMAVIEEAAERYGLSPESSRQFSNFVKEEFLRDLGIEPESFNLWFPPNRDFFFQLYPGQACAAVLPLSFVHLNFDVPYLAGYSEANPHRIYIDRGLTVRAAIPFLVVHEVFEKALMDLLKFERKLYVRTHQFAQRMEKGCVEGLGLNWHTYDRSLSSDIEKAEKRKPSRVPRDLDLAPYVEYQDWKLIERMKKAMVSGDSE